MGSPFGRKEGAVLVAVERANGGELAPLEQVIWTLDSLTPPGSHLDASQFASSTGLLIELGVVEYLEGQLGLTVEGRKLLRRSGLSYDPRHVDHVTDLLQQFDDLDIEERLGDDPLPAPTEDDVRQAISEGEQILETGDLAGPVTGTEVPTTSTLGLGTVGLVTGPHWVPTVPPQGSEDSDEPPVPPPYSGAPAHPVLERLFARRRKARD